jgi:hypothetical protein
MYDPPLDHGSRAGVTSYFIFEFQERKGKGNPAHDLYLDVAGRRMCLLDSTRFQGGYIIGSWGYLTGEFRRDGS